MDDALKEKIIGSEIKVIDTDYNKEKDAMEEVEAIVKVLAFIQNDTIAVVEKQVPYSKELVAGSKIKLEFIFTEKLSLDIKTNKIMPRNGSQVLINENTKNFTNALNEAYHKLESENNIYYIYRHFGPTNQATFKSTILIGAVTDQKEANEIIMKDQKTYIDEAFEFDKRPQKFTYSISLGKTQYIEPKED